MFPGEDPICKTVTSFAQQDGPVTVIGVVADSRINTLKNVVAMFTCPIGSEPRGRYPS